LPIAHCLLWRLPLGPAPLTLADDSHMLGTAAMAAVAKVTDETLYQWHKRGCPCEMSTDGTRRWNKDKVLAWREKNRPEAQMKGGKRPNAGRKRGAASRIKAMVMAGGETQTTEANAQTGARQSGRIAVGEVVDAGNIVGGGSGGGQMSLKALVDDEVKRLAKEIVDECWGDMKGMMALVKAGGLSVIEAQTLAKIVETQKNHLELKKAEGELVDAGEVKLALGHALTKVRAVLDQTPDRAAAKVVSECGLRGSDINKVRKVVAEEMRRACEGLVKALGEGENKAQSTEHK